MVFVNISGARLNTTVLKTKSASYVVDCISECVNEPCCRSVNFKKSCALHNCEMLHNLAYNTSEELLEKNASFDYIYITNPRKVRKRDGKTWRWSCERAGG